MDTEKILNNIDEIIKDIGEKNSKRFSFDQLKRIIKRLSEFSGNCKECENYLIKLDEHIEKLKAKHGSLDKSDLKEHSYIQQSIISHLMKAHKLITEGYYLGTFLPMGMSLGLVFGLLLSKNIGLGIPIGLCLGVAIGTSLDADAKKKGLTI